MINRILYIHNGSDLYGASRSLLRLVSRLDKARFEPLVILPSQGPLAEALRVNGVRVTIMRSLAVISRTVFHSWKILTFLFMVPLSAAVLVKFIRQNKIDLVHTNLGTVVSTGLAAKLARVPHIWHIRDSFHEYGSLWKLYSKYILWFSDKVICVSTPIAKQFHNDGGKVIVVHNGVPIEEFEGITEERTGAFRERFGLNNKRTVGVIGRIKFQRKGQDFFVKSIALLRKKREDVKYLIVGSSFPGNENHLHNLSKLINELGLGDDIILTGDIEDIVAVYKTLDVLVLPSCQPEPFAGVVLEAMAIGTPVIGTRIGGTVEQIEDGVSGILIEPNNTQMLAEKIELLLDDRDLFERIRRGARRRVEENFRFEAMYGRLMGIYREVLTSQQESSSH